MSGFIKNPFDGQLATFDCTVPEDRFDDYREAAEALRSIAKKWVFQLEQGEETGYRHWQMRVSLIKKTRFAAFSKEVMPVLPGCWSVTSKTVHDSGNQFNYVMKAQTRLQGPWKDTDADLRPPPEMTDQLRNFLSKDMYPWQQAMLDIVQQYNERTLYYVYDPHYNSGKSIFAEYLEYRMLAEEIPPFTLMEDIMQFVMCMHTSKCYIFDMPAAMKKEKVNQLYSGLEMLKNGFLYDKRYSGKKRRITRPQVLVFANDLPKLDLMAPDRWTVMYITPDKDLVPYDSNLHPLIQADPGDPALS